MAYLIAENGQRTEIKPAGKEFTQEELRGVLGGALDVFELPGDLFAVTIRSARKIGAEQNKAAQAVYIIHLAHLETEGKLPLDETHNPPPQFYGPVIFCRSNELGSEPVYTGTGDGQQADPSEGTSEVV